MRLPLELRTERLVLRAPRAEDAQTIFARYASDPEVTRLLSWPRHESIHDTQAFLAMAAQEREDGTAFAYLIESERDGRLLGCTGLTIEGSHRATTAYVLARDAWGHGYATEALRKIVAEAQAVLGVTRLSALCHVAHAASETVLGKGGFVREGTLRGHTVFPNLGVSEPQDVAIWALVKAVQTAHQEDVRLEQPERIAHRIAARHGVPDLVELLSGAMSGSELTSVLLAVSSKRAGKAPGVFPHLLSNYRLVPALAPSRVPFARLREIESVAFAAASDFEAVDLSPVQPFGLNRATGIHQNNVVSTVRPWELLADPTSQLALDAAERRRADRSHTVRLCACARVMRLQPTQLKGYAPHFRMFGLVSAGRATADEAFERDELSRHAIILVRMLRELGVRVLRVELSDARATLALLATAGLGSEEVRAAVRTHRPNSGPDLLAQRGVQLPLLEGDMGAALSGLPLASELRSRLVRMHERTALPLAGHLGIPVHVELSRLHGLGYYESWQLGIVVGDDAGEATIADGGVVTWTQSMLSDRKERLVTSGIGVEYLGSRFVTAPNRAQTNLQSTPDASPKG